MQLNSILWSFFNWCKFSGRKVVQRWKKNKTKTSTRHSKTDTFLATAQYLKPICEHRIKYNFLRIILSFNWVHELNWCNGFRNNCGFFPRLLKIYILIKTILSY